MCVTFNLPGATIDVRLDSSCVYRKQSRVEDKLPGLWPVVECDLKTAEFWDSFLDQNHLIENRKGMILIEDCRILVYDDLQADICSTIDLPITDAIRMAFKTVPTWIRANPSSNYTYYDSEGDD